MHARFFSDLGPNFIKNKFNKVKLFTDFISFVFSSYSISTSLKNSNIFNIVFPCFLRAPGKVRSVLLAYNLLLFSS